jgi:hypothetical protein
LYFGTMIRVYGRQSPGKAIGGIGIGCTVAKNITINGEV